ncbi:NUDIX domain-containing protein [Streptomyces sp. NBC_01717]|uniref:NUDIX hydrolase n=1 Tax=Streptomyces sp. NBC_01717 TaxID=2975918 RepID=UPI002E3312CF|nr:NUDIX domain-containing protein [Streptomyces sp. NBC_01717]
MPPSVQHIRAITETYLSRYPHERDGLAPLFTALAGDDDPTSRKTFPAHVTCSAILLDHDKRILHIHHKASGKVLAPGGHNEAEDPDLPTAALRELHEEAGIPPSAVVALPGFADIPFDIDVHAIDANPSKGEPDHKHIDFRWIFRLRSEHDVTLQTAEVGGYEWRPFTEAAAPTVRTKLALL